MKTVAVVLGLLVLGSASWAQTKSDEQLSPFVRLYQPKNLTPERAQRVAQFVNKLGTGDVQVSWEDVPQALAIRSMRIPPHPEQMDAAEALLKRFDVPDRTVELTVYLIRAETYPPRPPGPRQPAPAPKPVPADLKAAIDEMKGAFNYDHYALLDTIVLQTKSRGEVQGILQTPNGSPSSDVIPLPPPSVYNLMYSTPGSPTESSTLTLSQFQFSIKFGEIDSHIMESDLSIREGQKLVLGKIRLLNANADLFLVLTTKIN
jgi:hypothetical protein